MEKLWKKTLFSIIMSHHTLKIVNINKKQKIKIIQTKKNINDFIMQSHVSQKFYFFKILSYYVHFTLL